MIDGQLSEHIFKEEELQQLNRSFIETTIDGELHYLFPYPPRKSLGTYDGVIISLRRTPKGRLQGFIQSSSDKKNYKFFPKTNEKALSWQNCEPYKSKVYEFDLIECCATKRTLVQNLKIKKSKEI